MASVKIDLGFGEQAILSNRVVSGPSTAQRQRDMEDFLRRWPRTRSIHQERGYLKELGLHLGFHPPGVNPSDASALLRAAVKSGRVVVAIERTATRTGGGASASQPMRRSGTIEPSRRSFEEMAAGSNDISSTLADVAPAAKSRSYDWLSSYDDVTANDLIAYLEDFVSRTSGQAGASAPDADPTTPLGDAQPFEYSEDTEQENAVEVAARGVSEEDEAECYTQYERDMDECNAYRSAMGGARFMESCSQRAFMNYQQCRGY